eukprot:scaffold493181_cov32-Prasinocladus_malaysianus.AAC.1
MQRDSSPGTTLRAIIVDSSNPSDATNRNGSKSLASLFDFGHSSPPGRVERSAMTLDGTFQPSAQIFEEAYPDVDDGGWTDYVSAAISPSGVPSRVWHGVVGTVTNDWFCVQGGWKVELMMFAVNTNLRTIVSPDNLNDADLIAPYVEQSNIQVAGLRGIVAHKLRAFMKNLPPPPAATAINYRPCA